MQNVKRANLLPTRIAVSATFFTIGAIFANWVARIPEVKANLNLTDATLGLALMISSIGVIFGLITASGLIARFGSKNVSVFSAILYAITLGILGFASNFFTLASVLFFAGMFNSITDVAMNAQGIEVERLADKQIMNSFHAFWSIGTGAGALMGAGFVAFGFTVQQHFLFVPIFFIILMLASRSYLLDIEGEQNSEEQAAFQLPPRILWGLGAVVFVAGLSEGAIIEWSGLYLHEIVGTTEAIAALGLVAFSSTMIIGRFAGDTMADRLGASRLVRINGLIAALGVALALIVPTIWTTFIGFAMVGIGLAVPIPLAFSVAGKLPGLPSGRAVAGVATIGYAAFLIGPTIIGFISEATNLRIALIIVMILAFSLVFTGGALDIRKEKP